MSLLQTREIYKVKTFLTKYLSSDLLSQVKTYWHEIDSDSKRAFLICFCVGALVHLIFIVHQPMHNHGILSRLLYTNPMEQWPAGRWFSVFIFRFFNDSNLMVILPLVTLCLHISGGILTIRLWQKDASLFLLTIGGLLVSLYPGVMTSFNFSFVGPIFSAPHLLAPLILLVASRSGWSGVFWGAALTCVMMATYQPGLSIVSTLFATYAIVVAIEDKSGKVKNLLTQLLLKLGPCAIAIVGGVIFYKISLLLLSIPASQTTQTIALDDLLPRSVRVVKESIKALYLTQPELLSSVKNVLLAVLSIASVTLMVITCRSFRGVELLLKIFVLSVLMAGAVLATKAMYLVSTNNNFWLYRYNHALAYLYLFGFWVLFRHIKEGALRNTAYAVLAFILIRFAYADIGRQQVLLRAQTHYLSMANRVLYRIESLPAIDMEIEYKVVRLGSFSKFKLEQLSRMGHESDNGGSSHMDAELSPIWGPGDIFNYLGARVKLQGYMNPDYLKDIELATRLAQGRGRWPSADSIFIHKNMIIINM